MNMKRFFALLLALALCLTPLSALAEGEEPEDVEEVYIVANNAGQSKDVTVGNVAGGDGVSVTTRGDAQVSVTAKNVSSDDDSGIDATAYDASTITVNTGTVTSFSDDETAVCIIAFSSSTITLTAGDVASSSVNLYAVNVTAYSSSTASVTTENVEAAGDGVFIFGTSNNLTELTVNGSVEAGSSGLIASATKDPRDSSIHGHVIVAVTGDVTAEYNGVEATAGNGSATEVSVTGDVKGGGRYGLLASSGNDASLEVAVGGSVTGKVSGIYSSTDSGSTASITVAGDVAGEQNGVKVHPSDADGSAEILIAGTLSAGEQAVLVNEDVTEDSLSLTVWKIQQQGAGETLVTGSGTGANAFTDTSIRYIVRTVASILFGDTKAGTLSAARDDKGTALDTVTAGTTAYEVAHEGDKVYLNMDFDTDKYEVDGAYTDEEKKVAAEKDESGNYFATVTKGGGMSLSVVLKEKHIHTPGQPVEENVVPATCQHAGGYDKVVYCTACGEEISREAVVIGKLLHTAGEPVQENLVPATCQHAGGYDLVTYCTACGDELSREHADIGKLLHTEGEPVQENVVPATCQHAGGYDLVTYCTVCGDELSREAVVIGKLLHTAGEPVAENLVPAKIGQEGSYDEVVYCTVCGDELSREHRVLPALAEEDPFTAFCNTLAERILAAPKNGTVEADASAFSGLQRVVFAALRLRPDVTLKVTYNNGQLTVPAGADLMAKLGDALTLTFEDIAKLLG